MPRDARHPNRWRQRRSPSPRWRSPSREDVRSRYRSRERLRGRSPQQPPTHWSPAAHEQDENVTAEITHVYRAGTETKQGGLGESYSSEGNITDGSTPPTSLSLSSHDTSRVGFHHPDLETFAKDLNDAAKAAYPNGPKLGRNRYQTVHACLIRWEGTPEFQNELEELDKTFQQYGFTTTVWLIPRVNSYRDLMRKTLDFIDAGDSPGNLFVVYYAGHGRMNNTRQAEWVSHQGPNCSSLDWSGIQTLFAGAKSEVLILLDTCAAASSAATSQFGIMETIAACGFESRAAPPGEFSFTNALIEIMRDWINKPSFSVSVLHTEILFQLKQKENKRGREGTKLEWCSSPIYLRYTQDTRSPGIELYRRTSPATPETVPVIPQRPTTYTHATEVNLENINPKMSPFYSLSQDKRYRVPRVLISISLEEDQPQLDSENCTRWFANIPFLAADVEVFPSCSTLMIMSVPLPVWNMFPDHPACSLIGYVTAPKLKKIGFLGEICDSEGTQIKQETSAASSLGDTDIRIAASQWKPEMSLQPDFTLKREPHVTSEKHGLTGSGRSTPTKKSNFEWTSRSTSIDASIFAKPTFTDTEVPTLKELEEKRYTELKNIEVEEWRSTCGSSDSGNDTFSGSRPLDPAEGNEIQPVDDAASTRNNKISEDETYYDIPKAAVEFNEADLGVIIRRQWTAAPTIAPRTFTQYQPPTANEAIKIYKENADMYSVTSRRASWGTQRGSETALVEIEPNAASGNFLKRFLLKKSGDLQKSRRSTILETGLSLLSNIVHKKSRRDAKLKGVRSSPHQENPQSLSPKISSASPWKPKLPTSQTSFAAMSGPLAAMGTGIFDVDDPEENIDEELDSDDDDEAMKVEAEQEEKIVPNYEGFKAHIRRLNPEMDPNYEWLVGRIAHQQEIRYKSLLENRVRHKQAIVGGSCSAGQHCLALGKSVVSLDTKGNPRESERSSPGLQLVTDFSDDENLEGVLTNETFQAGIPMPPVRSLPAVFECPFCFNAKKFQKPSDWTKHIHEDIQAFTCTYETCKDSKSFKRKADWVRHENERHRHLEWWICQFDDCRHTCYRKDNFIQHLVREHKLPEPKQNTKAAIKSARLTEPVWIMLEQCHHEAQNAPQDEPCKFCGKSFPTWREMTNHLAKHMEHITLPILRLVEARNVDTNTIISPVERNLTRVASTGLKREHSRSSGSLSDMDTAALNFPVPQYFAMSGFDRGPGAAIGMSSIGEGYVSETVESPKGMRSKSDFSALHASVATKYEN